MLDRLSVAMRAALFGTVFVTFWGSAALWMRRLDSTAGAAAPSYTPLIGAVVLTTGAMLALASIVAFVVRGRGTPAPFDPPRVFVATGPYRLIRNPMYVGGWLALVGPAIVEQSAAMLAFSVAWLGLAHAFVVGYEERTLAERFGNEYLDYCRRVPRWLPVTRRRSLRHS